MKHSIFYLSLLTVLLLSLLAAGCGDDGSTTFVNPTSTPVPVPTAGATNSTISGIVYGTDNQPLDGATVRLTPLTGVTGSEDYGQVQEDTTENGGQFTFTVRYAGDYRIEARNGNTLLGSQECNVSLGDTLNLTLGTPELATLTVDVSDGTNPVPDATLTLSRTGVTSSEFQSGQAGSYIFNNMEPGNYKLSVGASGYYPYTKNDLVLTAGSNSYSVVLTAYEIPAPSLQSIIGGTFTMGDSAGGGNPDELPTHDVTLSDFHMGTYEVTNSEYCAFLNAVGENKVEGQGGIQWVNIKQDIYCGLIDNGDGTFSVKAGYENRPVVYVSWYGAVAFCNWLTEVTDELGSEEKCYGDFGNRGNVDISKKGFRLPTEAEWEYGCRGGTPAANTYFWGAGNIDDYCWYNSNSGDNHHDVTTLNPNPYGLYHMSGNVYEWCSDWYASDYYTTGGPPWNNPTGPSTGSSRVKRGGSWRYSASECRSSFRYYSYPAERLNFIGFRLCRTE